MILHLSQDDPKKCSARKLARFDKAVLVERFKDLPFGSLLLDPFSKIALSPADRKILQRSGIVAVDCSWEDADNVFKKIRKGHRFKPRALPILMAVNPVKFGKWGELSTLEALAASYYILGYKEVSRDLLSIYNWADKFIEINREPLEAYSACENSSEVVKVQSEFI
jgi:pre-rRNA-processing protein TSR3